MTPDCTIIARTAAETVAVTPYLLGFHPHDSLVVVGFAGHRVIFGVRFDLPPPDCASDTFDESIDLIVRQRAQAVLVLAYGPPTGVTRPALLLGVGLRRAGVAMLDVIRVTGDRWWSFTCQGRGCCPVEGNPCRPEQSAAVAEAVFQGRVALPSRQALSERVAPIGGAVRTEMAAATERARNRLGGADDPPGQRLWRLGRRAVRTAERRARLGQPPTADEAAWLGVLLTDETILEYALMRRSGDEWWLQLWIDVLRRVEPPFVAAPACLVGYVAWREGDGSLARVAVDRALRADAGHRTAGLLDRVLSAGIAPSALVALRPPPGPPGPTGPGRQRGGTGGGRRIRRGTHRRSM